MNLDSAQHNLANGIAVTRESWPDEHYVDAMFADHTHVGDGSRYPYECSDGSRYRMVKYTDNGVGDGEPYEPTEDDKAATDWESA